MNIKAFVMNNPAYQKHGTLKYVDKMFLLNVSTLSFYSHSIKHKNTPQTLIISTL